MSPAHPIIWVIAILLFIQFLNVTYHEFYNEAKPEIVGSFIGAILGFARARKLGERSILDNLVIPEAVALLSIGVISFLYRSRGSS